MNKVKITRLVSALLHNAAAIGAGVTAALVTPGGGRSCMYVHDGGRLSKLVLLSPTCAAANVG
jgi:hypothetical protein